MEAVLQGIVEYIVYLTDPDEILLFGSMVSVRQNIHSDIDLLVISENQYQRNATQRDIKGFVSRLGFRADVIILTRSELDAEMTHPQGFFFNALKMSRKMYKK
jgi:predicted nucleotidyltransferase